MNKPPASASRKLEAALRAAGIAEVDSSARARAQYSTDASLYQVMPVAVAAPRSRDEVQAAVAIARERGIPVTARGAGTSIAGNAVGAGLVLDFSRHLDRVLELDPEAAPRVEPGLILDELQAQARPHGLRFGPDPSTHDRCTIGGMIGNNACGSRALGYGRTSDNVTAMTLLTGRGEELELGGGGDAANPARFLTLAREAIGRHLAVIRTELGRFGRQVSGYALEHMLPERGFDAARAAVGSEGTWGVLLEATLNLVPLPSRTVLVALGYPDMATAADTTPALLPHRPAAMEGLDSRIVDAVRARRSDVPDLPPGQGWLFVELGGDDEAELHERARRLVADAGALGHRVLTGAAETAAVWRIREDGAGLAARPHGGQMSHAGWEDAAVPVHRLGDYLREFDALLLEHGLPGAPYGHFGEGCVHVRIDFPLHADHGLAAYRTFIEAAAKLVVSHGGSMSGEHGDGRARSELLPHLYSAETLAAFAEVKSAFDPDDIMNPGVLVAPHPFDADLRVPAARPFRTALPLAFADDGGTSVTPCIAAPASGNAAHRRRRARATG